MGARPPGAGCSSAVSGSGASGGACEQNLTSGFSHPASEASAVEIVNEMPSVRFQFHPIFYMEAASDAFVARKFVGAELRSAFAEVTSTSTQSS